MASRKIKTGYFYTVSVKNQGRGKVMERKAGRTRKVLCMITGLLMIGLVAGIASPQVVNAAVQATYFVSTTGNDSTGNGSIGSPWHTIQKARDVVDTVNSSMTGDIVVYLRSGTYQLSSTVTFDSDDSGSNGYNVIYQAYPGETPVISGGKTIGNWSQDPLNSSIYRAAVSASDDFRQIYVNGARGTRARTTGALPSGITLTKTATGYTANNSTMSTWGNKDKIEFA